jgi:uncharacterized protein
VNSPEHRPRAWLRLLCFGLLSVVLIFIMEFIAAIVFAVTDSKSTGDNISALVANPLWNSIIVLLAIGSSYIISSLWLDRRKISDIGFHFNKFWWRDFIFGLFLGLISFGLLFAIELMAGWVTITGVLQPAPDNQSILMNILQYGIIFFCVGIYEEILGRGYIMRNLAEGLRGRFLNSKQALFAAYILSSLIFSLMHFLNPNSGALSTLFLSVAGLQLGLGYLLTGSLAIPISLHMAWNFSEGVIFGFPVSGITVSSSIFAIKQGGSDIVTGGGFGPEAGLMGLAAIVFGCAMILLWIHVTRGSIKIDTSLAVYTHRNKSDVNPVIDQSEE